MATTKQVNRIKDAPLKLRPFLDLGYDEQRRTGSESIGTCPFCHKVSKFYVNTDTGLYSCKAGHCQAEGNIFSYLTKWVSDREDDVHSPELDDAWEALAEDRGLPVEALRASGIVYDGDRWAIPVKNRNGAFVNVRFWRKGVKVQNVNGLDLQLYGVEALTDIKKRKWPVWLVEGEFDKIALDIILANAGVQAIALAVPGAGTFKDAWAEMLADRDVILCYDNDIDGKKGMKRCYTRIRSVATSVKMVEWPEDYPDKFDLRDYFKVDGGWENLEDLVVPWKNPLPNAATGEAADERESRYQTVEFIPLDLKRRPSFEGDVLPVFDKFMEMRPELYGFVRVCFATVLTSQMKGSPIWMHGVGVPGSGKTEILMALSGVGNTVTESTLTPHSLVSGFIMPGGKDPSLLPQLFGKTFILKDFTEVLRMNKTQRDEIYSILRGAYDGLVQKPYGNGQRRDYRGYFTMLTGVTPSIYGESNTSLGERFLLYHIKHVPGTDNNSVVLRAMSNSGREEAMKQELQDAAKRFLEWKIEHDQFPELSRPQQTKTAYLAQVVSMLRASVDRVGQSERITHRPNYEIGTRIGVQLQKLGRGLAMLNDQPHFGDTEYELLQKVGVDTCIGFNSDALFGMARHDGRTVTELSEDIHVPVSTLREQLEDMCALGIINKSQGERTGQRGRPSARYWLTDAVRKFWAGASLPGNPFHAVAAASSAPMDPKPRKLQPARIPAKAKTAPVVRKAARRVRVEKEE